jgi:hypothetical protein
MNKNNLDIDANNDYHIYDFNNTEWNMESDLELGLNIQNNEIIDELHEQINENPLYINQIDNNEDSVIQIDDNIFEKIDKVEIVVSRYDETLEWTLEYPFNLFKYTVYNKGNNCDFEKLHVKKIINLQNLGKYEHTYLYHIIYNYNNLSEILVFFPGSINTKNKKDKAKNILEKIIYYKFNEAIFIAKITKNNIYNEFKDFEINDPTIEKCIMRPYGKWFLFHFGNINAYIYSNDSIFSIHKKDILQHNVLRYKRLMYGLSRHSNPEICSYITKSWAAIFYPLTNTKIIFVEEDNHE